MLYIRLYMDDWGDDGLVLGPYEFVHTTYTTVIRLGKPDGNNDSLYLYEDMLYYNGIYYGDWSVFTDEILKKGKFVITPFEQLKANLPIR